MPKMIGYQEQINGLVFLSEDTDGGATVEFDIPAGYASIEWHFYNIHPATDNVTFGFQVNAAGGSGYDEYITSSYFRAKHNEDDSATGLDYIGDFDQAQTQLYQVLPNEVGNDNDQSTSGVLTMYAPSSTYVKHFTARFSDAHPSDIAMDCVIGGYINSITAIDQISFKFSSGNIQAGTIRMYGVR